MQTWSKGHTYTNPRPGQYLTHAHSHITRQVAATDNCFALIGAHWHDKAVALMNGENQRLKNPLLPRWVQSCLSSTSSTRHMFWLGTAQQFYHDMRGEGGSRVTSKLKQSAHMHQSTAWPLPHACAQSYHADSGSYEQLFHQHGIAVGHWKGKTRVQKTLSCRGESFKCQLHATHVEDVGSEPHCSSPTTCAGNADHGFGVSVPFALICLLKIVN